MLRVSIVELNSFNIKSITPVAIIEDVNKLDVVRKYLRSEFKLWFSTEPFINSTDDRTTFNCTNNEKYILRVEIINDGIYFLYS